MASQAAEEVAAYLKQHNITDILNESINRLCEARPDDPWGFLSRDLAKQARAPVVSRLVGREVIDSRAFPTVQVDVFAIVNGEEELVAREQAPSGASVGSNEALQLLDADPNRFLKKGVTRAAQNVTRFLSEAVAGLECTALRLADDAMCAKDGTQLKQNVGGNAITAASFALARAGAHVAHKELFLHIAELFFGGAGAGGASARAGAAASGVPDRFHLPRPMVNILNGGKHAGGDLQIQEFMIVPRADAPYRENLRVVVEVYHHLGRILVSEFGEHAKNLGDEGGYAAPVSDPDEVLTLIEQAIQNAGYKVGGDVSLAIDAAASEFFENGKYEIRPKDWRTSEEMIDFYADLKRRHPALISIEDGLHEHDYAGWAAMTSRFETEFPDVMIVGDDLYTTNTDLIRRGIEERWANALLLKVNQIGTVSEAMDAARLIYADRGQVIVSHRSGETTSTLIADLVVGIGANFIKTGAPARGERTAKYNRLLQIEEYLEANGMIEL